MFSSTRLYAFVCLALGITVHAAPAGSPDANIDARSPDLYDLSGGLGALLLGISGGESYGGDGDSDAYILKRQLAGLDVGSRLGSNMGIQHAASLAAGALGAGTSTQSDVETRSPDLYDLSGGLGALLLGLSGGESYGGDSDEDAYILKRQLADIGSRLGSNMGVQHAATLAAGALGAGASAQSDVEARSPDLYDLSGGLGALLLGLSGGEGYDGDSDEDAYILKRQLEGLGLGSATNFDSAANLPSFGDIDAASLLKSNTATTSTGTSTGVSAANAIGAGSSLDTDSILSSFGGNTGAAGNLASSFGLGN